MKIYKYLICRRSDHCGWDILILMELLTPVTAYLSGIPLTEQEVIKMAIDICSALEYCEKLNIIHRDIKPGNIFVSTDGVYKLGDFGIAESLNEKERRTVKLGSHNYIAPEVYRGEAYDFRADLYSLGLVLYQLMNNYRLPLLPEYPAPITMQETEKACFNRLKGKSFPPPRFAGREFSNVIIKATSFEIENRYQTAFDFKAALKSITDASSVKISSEEVEIPEENASFNRTALIFYKDETNMYETKRGSDQKVEKCTNANVVQASFADRIVVKMINWFGFTCFFSLVPVLIFLLFNALFSINFPLIDKLITEFLYFGLTISVITIREMVSLELWKKEKSIYLIALFIMLLVLIFSSVFFGVMILNEMNVLNIVVANRFLFLGAIILSISSLITGTFIQVWEEM